MKVNEYKIGNYIHATHEVEIDRGNGIIEDVETTLLLRIRGIDEDGQLVDGSCAFSLEEIGTDYQLEKYMDLQPIPLTEEWLFNFGFEVQETSESLKGFGRDDIDYIFLSGITENKNMILIWSIKLNGVLTHVEHVHQLQNLYFALTGEELTLTFHMEGKKK